MMRAIREDEVLLYTGPLKTDEVDALECIAKTFKIEYVRQDLTQQMVEAASKDQLKYMCKFRKLQVSGTKKDLVARLVPFTIAIET
ncbi:hypothetical protein WJX75_006467 [Coccomyxa subellipsoidea]|uniref:SAP domain-containing protein n=1 Tax=Coccomyxa subellipsoidea TaxID=248742 RepID=A0ABR2YYN2_9CHLO